MKKKVNKKEQNAYERPAYKFDRAMQEAAKRASSHPKMVAMTTNVREKK